ncbi:MAG: hypothetical protein AAFQ13_10835, partial [Pseudomonadota bacterium]
MANSSNQASNQMWGGRFAGGPSAIMREINASIPFDKALRDGKGVVLAHNPLRRQHRHMRF